MRLDLNLATHPYEDAQVFWRRWGSGVALLAIFTIALLSFVGRSWYGAQWDRNEIVSIQKGITSLDAKLAHAQEVMNRPQNRTLRARSDYLNNLFQQKAFFSWTRVFEDLERLMPPRVHVVSIRPEVTPDNQLQINLRIAGDSREHTLDLVRKMEDSQRFQQTRIHDESTNRSTQTPGDEVQLEISALYAEAAPAKKGGR